MWNKNVAGDGCGVTKRHNGLLKNVAFAINKKKGKW